jgi:hypothetical protein
MPPSNLTVKTAPRTCSRFTVTLLLYRVAQPARVCISGVINTHVNLTQVQIKTGERFLTVLLISSISVSCIWKQDDVVTAFMLLYLCAHVKPDLSPHKTSVRKSVMKEVYNTSVQGSLFTPLRSTVQIKLYWYPTTLSHIFRHIWGI